MKFAMPNRAGRGRDSGQIMVLFVLLMVVLILFIGLGIDLGFSYITRANLSKAVDAAALMGAMNLSQGTITAQAVARSAFDLNYGVSSRDVDEPHVDVQPFTDANGNQAVHVTATVSINTFFIRVLPQWSTLEVASSAEATRSKLIMTLVLDRSGSMHFNGGEQALPPAVKSFISLFDDKLDYVAMVSFASTATVDVPIQHNFKAQINTALDSLIFTNCTFSQGGLTNALVQNGSISDDNAVKVTVFFTDGLANMFQDTIDCPTPTLLNIGGFDEDRDPCVGFNFPDNELRLGTKNCYLGSNYCAETSQFLSAIDGSMEDFVRTNTTAEAQWRAIQTALDMKKAGTHIFAIGLGNDIDSQFLLRIANDPASAFHDDALPTGQAVFAPTADDLQQVFQSIASQILLRLTK